jgi:hypothetical protein
MKMILEDAWNNFWMLRKKRNEPWWARFVVAIRLGLGMSLFMLVTYSIMMLAVYKIYSSPEPFDFTFLYLALRDCTFEGFSIAFIFVLLLRGVELLLPDSFLKRISATQDWRYGVILSAITAIGVGAGIVLGVGLIGLMESGKFWFGGESHFSLHTVWFLTVVAGINLLWWRVRLRQQKLRHQASEAQLRLLQAQIEPHFLFNTLANVQSLMDYDVVGARELEMARNYLQLMQLRMKERLEFAIDASEEACKAALPTLLLQPLIENAIQHGLEPKVEGGAVRIEAKMQADRLQIRITDDGMGLDAPSRSLRRGNGMALTNLRERLHTRYGALASLTLTASTAGDAGTCALLDLPYESKP